MCRRVQCATCGKPTYEGCGQHIERVLGDVADADRCHCRDAPSTVPPRAQRALLVAYATREGQTQRIAEHAATTLRERGHRVDVVDVGSLPEDFDLAAYAAVILAASVHAGRHEREMESFVKSHRAALDLVPTAFLSVSLAEAGAENQAASAEARRRSAEEVHQTIERFFTDTGWHPGQVEPVAGALPYRQYGLFKRLAMRLIVARRGGDVDTSRDYEYTDWAALDRFVTELGVRLPE